jgi:hypothetical protein
MDYELRLKIKKICREFPDECTSKKILRLLENERIKTLYCQGVQGDARHKIQVVRSLQDNKARLHEK